MTAALIIVGLIILAIMYDDFVPKRGDPKRPIRAKKRKVRVRKIER